jgi:diguanylate cyclase (GGDEF)-like protein
MEGPIIAPNPFSQLGLGRLAETSALIGDACTQAETSTPGEPLPSAARTFAALSATSKAILQARTGAELYQQFCEAALRGGNIIGAAILAREPGADLLRPVAAAGKVPEQISLPIIPIPESSSVGENFACIAFRTGAPHIINDVLNEDRCIAWHIEAQTKGIGAAGAFPLTRGGLTVGVLIACISIVGALDDELVSLLQTMADNLSFALDNFDREAEFKSSERANRRLARMFAALSATNEAILRAKCPEELYQLVCDAGVHGGKFFGATVLLNEPGSPWLTAVAGTGGTDALVKQARFSIEPENPYGKGVCGTAFRTQKPCINKDILNSEQARPWHEASRQSGIVACAALPLVKGGQSVGVLLFFLAKSWAADEEIIALLARLAENVSFALDNFEREEIRNRTEARVQYLVTHDDLTGLPNRVKFGQALNESVKAAQSANRKFGVMFIDLDRFKLINDTLGHVAGDLLLKEVSARLKHCVRDGNMVARLGGDEFVVLLNDACDAQEVSALARNILSAIGKSVFVHGQECAVTASIGISMFPADAQDEQSLTRNADAAMYLTKEQGRNGFRFFSSEVEMQSIERLMLETSLRHALGRDEFSLYYQAKRDMNGNVSGAEALLRWQHRDLGTLPPARFIPIAEETGLIVPIGKWVLETACSQNMAWQKQGLPPLRIAVNLSPRQFNNDDLLEHIWEALGNSGMPPNLLELEITESMVMQNVDRALRLLREIRKMGIHLAIDDFGTGYSSMSLLKLFPIDTIKIDQSFVRDLLTDADDRAITEAIIALAKALQLRIIAEGVETKEQEAFLREHACDEIQGYLFSEPIPADAFQVFVAQHHVSELKRRAAEGRSPPGQSSKGERRRADR